jgi:pimeloyl-ACP methyl ester carboxylesterase
LVSPELGQTAAAGNPRIRYESVVGASHSMHRDEYDTFWTLVQEFAAE